MKKWTQILLLITTLLLYSLPVLPQPIPDLQCTQVSNNNVTIFWSMPDMNFAGYILEKSINNDPFQPIDPPPSSTVLQYSYPETELGDNMISYRLCTYSISQFPDTTYYEFSDTISIINLNVNPVTLLYNGIAKLEWNQPAIDANGPYHIFRKTETGNWEEIGMTLNTIYYDTIMYPYCDSTLFFYQITSPNPEGSCEYISTIDQSYFLDINVPGNSQLPVEMDNVSLTLDGNVLIQWNPSSEKDIDYYVIWRIDQVGGTADSIAKVSADTLYYQDNNSSAVLHSVGYGVFAVDKCGNRGIGGYDKAFYTVFLKPMQWNYCDTSIFLQWNPVTWMQPSPSLYSIYAINKLTDEYSLVGTTPGYDYNYEAGFKPDSTYCFFIKADNSFGSSTTSCIQCFLANRPDQPDTLSMQFASVDTLTNDRINIAVFVDTVPASTTCALLRKVSVNDPYDTIFTSPVTKNENLFFTDTTAQVGQNPYYYKTVILDGCENASWLPLNEVRTIYLQGMANDQVNHLYWNRYRSSVSDVTGYRLYRKIDGLTDTIIDVGLDTLYDDYIYDQATGSGRFSYLVEARIVNKDNQDPDTLSSFSNEIAQARAAQLYMPTAFTPNNDAQNDYFAPQNSFSDDQADFIFLIYNRWGQKVYESTKISDIGWDGTLSGEPCPEGIYVYFIRYVSSEGEIYEKKGAITLLR